MLECFKIWGNIGVEVAEFGFMKDIKPIILSHPLFSRGKHFQKHTQSKLDSG